MRKNSPRKWVHALLDLLPLLILPIFALAVRSDNNFQTIEVQTQNHEVVDFNQLYKGNGTTSTSTGGTATFINNEIDIVVDTSVETDLYFAVPLNITFDSSHLYYLKSNSNSHFLLYTYIDSIFTQIKDNTIVSLNIGSSVASFLVTTDTIGYYTIKFNIFDITQMFGSGNEPTTIQFNDWYNEYYDYALSHKELLNVGTTTYNDTDVGSQMVYTLYNATDKYFNFNNVFNFGQLYDWFVLNIFNGNATLIFSVVWQIVLYEFIMDLVFLIYALFMFFIDFCTNLIDRFHVKCSGGK